MYNDSKKKRKEMINFLEYVSLSEYDVFFGIEHQIILVNRTNKEDIRYFFSGRQNDEELGKKIIYVLKKYFGRSKPLTQQDYINFLKLFHDDMKTSFQLLIMFKQNGMKIDDRICEKFDMLDFDRNNHVRCLYERVLMLKMLQDQHKQRFEGEVVFTPLTAKRQSSFLIQK